MNYQLPPTVDFKWGVFNRFFNQIEGVGGAKGRVGVWLGTPADNLLYENRNGIGLLFFLQNFLKSIPR